MGGFPANETRKARRFLANRLLEAISDLQEAVSPTDEGSLYGMLRADEASEIARATATVAATLVRRAGAGQGLRRADRAVLRSLGRQRATWSVPAPAVVEGFRRANRAAREVLRAAAFEHPQPLLACDAAIVLSGDLGDLVEQAIEEVRAGYAGMAEDDEDGSWVNDLVEGAWSARDALARSRSHGFELTDPCLVGVAIPLTPREAVGLRRRASALRNGHPLAVGRLAAEPHPHVPLLVSYEGGAPETTVASLGEAVDRQRLVVLADTAGLGSLAVGYRELRGQIDLARSESLVPRLVRPADLRLGRAVATIGLESVFGYLRETIGPVLADSDADELIDAMHAALSVDGGLRRVSNYSYSTIRRLVDDFEARSGLSYTKDRTEIDLALRLFRLHRRSLPRPGATAWAAPEADGPSASR